MNCQAASHVSDHCRQRQRAAEKGALEFADLETVARQLCANNGKVWDAPNRKRRHWRSLAERLIRLAYEDAPKVMVWLRWMV